MTPVSAFTARADEMLNALERVVTLESPSAQIEVVQRCVAEVAKLGESLLGETPDRLSTDAGHPLLRWQFGDRSRVLVLGHMDTVWPVGTIERRPFTISDGTARGPGVFDMKAGLIQGLYGLSTVGDLSGVTVLFNSDEELGSRWSRSIIEEHADGVEAVLVLEPSAAGGHLKASRKGVSRYMVTVEGLAAHVGLDPEAGVNALTELAHQVLAVQDLSDQEAGTSVVPTMATAGASVNQIPASASFRIDVRCNSTVEQQRVDTELRTRLESVTGAKLEVTGAPTRPVFEAAMSRELVRRAAVVADRLGLVGIDAVGVGGGSDGNFAAAMGIPVLDGLGPVGGGAHADSEHVLVRHMPERSALFAALVTDLLADQGGADG